VAQKFTVPITVKQLASAGSDAVTVYVDADTYARLKVEAGGRLTWGSGASAGDVNLYRDSADVLKTDDTFKTPALFVDNIEIDTTGATTNQALVFNGVKFVPSDVAASGGASLTVSDTAPASPSVGDLWFNSSNARTYVYYDSSWVEVGASGGVATLDNIGDVTAPTPTSGDFLKWNGTAWINDAIDLGTDTTGNYVASLVAGTGVTLANNTGEGATPTISVNGDSIYTTQVKHTVKNDDSVTLTKGMVVYTSGANGTNILVKRAGAGSEATSSQVLGFVEADIAVNAFGYIVNAGLVAGINTSAATAAGDPVWLSSSVLGGVVYGLASKPDAPNHLVYLGVVTKKNPSTGEIFVHISNGWELDELHNVSAATPTSGDFLKYNGTLWVNDQINLGTDTVGNYVSSVTAGTGISVTFTPSEGAGASVSLNATLDNLSDVTAPTPTSGDFLKWNGTAWVNDAIDLGTDTTGNYMSGVSVQNGLTVSHTPGEGSSATIGVDNALLSNFLLEGASGNSYGLIGTSAYLDVKNTNGYNKEIELDIVALETKLDTDGYITSTAHGSIDHSAVMASVVLDDIYDVNTSGASAGNVLTYNGSAWTAASAGGGGASVTVSQTPPASPSSGNLWFESDTARTYIYYDSFWVEVGGLAPTAIVSDTAPSSPVTGQVWFNSLNGGTYIYYSSAWTEVGAVPVNNLLNL
jgi:hypothetical protein